MLHCIEKKNLLNLIATEDKRSGSELDTRKGIDFTAYVEVQEPHYSFREGGARYWVVIQTSDECKLSTRGKRFPWLVDQTVGHINLALRLKVRQ